MNIRRKLVVIAPLLFLLLLCRPPAFHPAAGETSDGHLSLFVSSARAQGFDFSDFNLISVEDEIKMGKELAAEVEREHPAYPDSRVQKYVRDIAVRLAKSAPNASSIPMTIMVVKDDEVNAFTIPGGHLYVNSGLIKQADNEAELAGVIAHEMGHAVRRDGTKQLTRMYGMNLVLSLILGQDAPQWQQIVGDLFSTAGILAYGRGAEYEADKMAVRIERAAGWDPNQYLAFLQKLQEIEKSQPNLLTDLFSTHPDTQSRIEVVRGEIAGFAPPTKKLIVNTRNFDTIKRRIR
jgi:predicted Zn-dependent protease